MKNNNNKKGTKYIYRFYEHFKIEVGHVLWCSESLKHQILFMSSEKKKDIIKSITYKSHDSCAAGIIK